MTQQQKLDLKLIVWGLGIIITVLGTTFKLGTMISNETNRIYNSVEAVRTENRLQEKDIESLKREVANKADKSDVDNLRERITTRNRYRNGNE